MEFEFPGGFLNMEGDSGFQKCYYRQEESADSDVGGASALACWYSPRCYFFGSKFTDARGSTAHNGEPVHDDES